jgi:putative endonuclease
MRGLYGWAHEMKPHILTGKYGELLAENWLRRNGFAILLTNWRYGRYEIDIVASKNNIIHCVEVKTMRGNTFGFPEQQIRNSKLRHLCLAAVELMEQLKLDSLQIDILSVSVQYSAIEYFFIEDIFSGNQQP